MLAMSVKWPKLATLAKSETVIKLALWATLAKSAFCRNVALVGIVGQVGDVGKVGKVSKFSLVCGSDKVARCSIVSNT